MTPGSRKFVATLALLVFLIVYVLAAMAVAIVTQVNASRLAELAYYAIAGTAWVPVAAWLVSWMHKTN